MDKVRPQLRSIGILDNQNIEAKDVWMRMFVQSLDGEIRKWFRELAANSITIIEELQDLFMRQWGDTKDHTYYIIEFGALTRKKDEIVADFSKRFNKMYGIIPAEIKPLETSAKLTYANAFDHEFSLLLRERRPVTLLNMQDATLEVDSNILASNRLKGNIAQQIYDRKGKKEAAPGVSTSHSTEGKIDEMAKLVKILIEKLNKLELEKNSNKPVQEGDRNPNNPNQFRRQFVPRFIPRERRNNDIQ